LAALLSLMLTFVVPLTLTVPATETGLAVVFTTVTGAEPAVVGDVVVVDVFTCAELVRASAPINIAKPAVGRTMLGSKFLKVFPLFIFLFIFPSSFFEF
jgi:hypothetical protein